MVAVEPQLSTRIMIAFRDLKAARMDGKAEHIYSAVQLLNDLLEQWPTRRKV